MIIIINGSVGVGKTSVAEQLHWIFDKSIHLDGDCIGNVHPFEIYDVERIDHLYHTLALLVEFHQSHGYANFVINYIFESAGSLQQLLDLINPLDQSIHTYWLTCEKNELERRIRGRGGDEIDWELNRTVELQGIQRKAAGEGFIGKEIDTSGSSAARVAQEIWKDIFKSENPTGT